ncbi:MAG: hypothetical protein K6343_00075 [Caldisericaceae bacterium]
MKKINAFIILLVIFSLLPLTSIFGWNSHGLTLSYVLKNVQWLNQYNNITITPFTYKDDIKEKINPNFEIKYLDGAIGEKTTAYKILTTYADEPDWGLDSNLGLSKFQILMGDSQGYRHMFYKMGFIQIGENPNQIEFWFNMAKIARERNDYYWTFRFLARALHYMEDITQPYHGIPGPTFIVLSNIFKGIKALTIMCSNHHYALEDYQGYMVGIANKKYVETLEEYFMPLEVDDVKSIVWLGKYAASLNRERVKVLWPLEEKFFGPKVSGYKEEFHFNPSKLHLGEYNLDYQAEYDNAILYSLRYFNGFSRLLLEYTKKSLNL